MKRHSKQEIGVDLTSSKPTLAVAFMPGGETVQLEVTDLPWIGPAPLTSRQRRRFANLRKRFFGAPKPARAAQRKRAK